MWRTDNASNIDKCSSLNLIIFLIATSSPLQRLLDFGQSSFDQYDLSSDDEEYFTPKSRADVRPVLGVHSNSGNDTMWIGYQILTCITPICESIMLVISQVIVGVITHEPHVDQLVTSEHAPADSNIMTQLCRH